MPLNFIHHYLFSKHHPVSIRSTFSMKKLIDAPRLNSAKVYITSAYAESEAIIDFKKFAQLDKVRKHTIVNNPGDADIILFIEDLRGNQDYYFRKLKKHPLVKQYPKKVFMYNPRDVTWYILPGLYTCLPGQLNNPRFALGSPYIETINPFIKYDSVREPEYLFSFHGSLTSPVRHKVIELKHPRADISLSSQGMFVPDKPEHLMLHYASLLSNSKFILCPRGIGSSSMRLFETMRAGRVPVIISDDWVRPIGCDWDKFAVFVSEKDVAKIPELLEKEEANWPEKSRIARQNWEEHFAPETIFNYFIEAILNLYPRQKLPIRMKYENTLQFLDYFTRKEYRERIRHHLYALRDFFKSAR